MYMSRVLLKAFLFAKQTLRNITETKSVCLYVCVYVCLSLASNSSDSEPTTAIIIKLGTVTASDLIMHHVLNVLAFVKGHTDIILNV